MCKCTPNMKTPFCGKGDCQWPVNHDVSSYAGSPSFKKSKPEQLKDIFTPSINDTYGGSVYGTIKPEDMWANYGTTATPNVEGKLNGWHCPNCKKTHSPYVNTCPENK